MSGTASQLYNPQIGSEISIFVDVEENKVSFFLNTVCGLLIRRFHKQITKQQKKGERGTNRQAGRSCFNETLLCVCRLSGLMIYVVSVRTAVKIAV